MTTESLSTISFCHFTRRQLRIQQGSEGANRRKKTRVQVSAISGLTKKAFKYEGVVFQHVLGAFLGEPDLERATSDKLRDFQKDFDTTEGSADDKKLFSILKARFKKDKDFKLALKATGAHPLRYCGSGAFRKFGQISRCGEFVGENYYGKLVMRLRDLYFTSGEEGDDEEDDDSSSDSGSGSDSGSDSGSGSDDDEGGHKEGDVVESETETEKSTPSSSTSTDVLAAAAVLGA